MNEAAYSWHLQERYALGTLYALTALVYVNAPEIWAELALELALWQTCFPSLGRYANVPRMQATLKKSFVWKFCVSYHPWHPFGIAIGASPPCEPRCRKLPCGTLDSLCVVLLWYYRWRNGSEKRGQVEK